MVTYLAYLAPIYLTRLALTNLVWLSDSLLTWRILMHLALTNFTYLVFKDFT